MLRAYQFMAKNVDPTLWSTMGGIYGVDVDIQAINRMKSGNVTRPELEKSITEETAQGKGWLSEEDKKRKADIDKQVESAAQNISKGLDWLTTKIDPAVDQWFKEFNELFSTGLHKVRGANAGIQKRLSS